MRELKELKAFAEGQAAAWSQVLGFIEAIEHENEQAFEQFKLHNAGRVK